MLADDKRSNMFPAYAKSVPSPLNTETHALEEASTGAATTGASAETFDPSDWLKNSSFTPILGEVVYDEGKKDDSNEESDDYDDGDKYDGESLTKKRRKDDSESEEDRKKRKESDKSKKKKKDKKKEKKRKKDKKRSNREYEEYLSRHGGDGGRGRSGGSSGNSGGHRESPAITSSSRNGQCASYKPNVNTSKKGAIFIEDMYQLKPEDAFRIDRKCDVENILMESLYRQQIAHYRPHIPWTVGPKKIFVRKNDFGQKRNNRYFSKENRNLLKIPAKRTLTGAKEPVRVCVSTGNKATNDFFEPLSSLSSLVTTDAIQVSEDVLGDLSLIPLPPDDVEDAAPKPVVREGTGNVESLGIFDDKTLLYVKGQFNSEGAKEDGELDNEKEDTPSKTLEELVRLRIGKLNEDLTAKPNDIPLWMEMIHYQDEAVPILLGAMTGRTGDAKNKSAAAAKNVSREILEKKQAILDKALLKNPSSLDLQLLQFQLQRGLWDETKWKHAWKRLLFNHANDVDLHLRFLKNFKSTVATFNLTELLREFCASFTALRLNKGRSAHYSITDCRC